MTWEMPDKKWWQVLMPSAFFGLVALTLVIKFFSGGEATPASYRSSCEEQDGEWLEHALKPTCVFPGGKLVVFDDSQDGSKSQGGSLTPPPFQGGGRGEVERAAAAPKGRVVTSDDSITPPTDPAPECGYGKTGSFADYPATDSYTGRPHKPDFSTLPEAVKYRTAITNDVARGVNFGGVYVLSTWGRPDTFNESPTIGFAIVDARDGRIIDYAPSGKRVTWSGAVLAVDFEKDSRFFRVHSSTGPVAALISSGQEIECGRY